MTADKTCQSCLHWHQAPIDPNNLAKPRPGLCRAEPPQLVAIFTGQTTEVRPMYPILDGKFPACRLHEEVSNAVA